MNEIREIVTKAVVGKGKKLIRLQNIVTPDNEAYSILGCWIINHEFTATLDGDNVKIAGTYEINIWYSYNCNAATDIVRSRVDYNEIVKTRQIGCDVNNGSKDVIVRVCQHPTCTNAAINDDGICVDIVIELIVEVIGETKMIVTVFAPNEVTEEYEDDFENEINENFLNTDTDECIK